MKKLTALALGAAIGATGARVEAATRIWAGTGSQFLSVPGNWQGGVAPGPGDDVVFPGTAPQRALINDQALTVNSIDMQVAGYLLSGNPVTMGSFLCEAGAPGSTINAPIGILGSHLAVNVSPPGACTLAGPISGQTLVKLGPGTLFLSGNNSFNSFNISDGPVVISSPGALGNPSSGVVSNTGSLQISPAGGGDFTSNSGTLNLGSSSSTPALEVLSGAVTWAGMINVTAPAIIRNDSPSVLRLQGPLAGPANLTFPGPGSVEATADTLTGATTVSGGTLAAMGTIGPLLSMARLTAGPLAAPGTLTCGNLTLIGPGTLSVRINGPSIYSRIVVNGVITLPNPNPQLDITLNFVPQLGQQFTLLDNDATDPVNGTFSGLSEGSLVRSGSTFFQISYTGGTGNDVVLTVVPPPVVPATPPWASAAALLALATAGITARRRFSHRSA
jgi:hypothetical protein